MVWIIPVANAFLQYLSLMIYYPERIETSVIRGHRVCILMLSGIIILKIFRKVVRLHMYVLCVHVLQININNGITVV